MKIFDLNNLEIPAEPIVMAQEEAKIKYYQQNTNQLAGLLNNVLETYRELNLGELTMSELTSLVNKNNVEDLVRDKVSGNQPRKIAGLVFAADKVKEMVEIPDTTEIEQAINHVKSFFNMLKSQNRVTILLNHFEIVEGEVKVTQKATQHNIDFYTTYASTPAEKESYLILMEVAEVLRYLKEKHNLSALRQQGNAAPLYQTYSPQEGILTYIDPHLLKSYLNPRVY